MTDSSEIERRDGSEDGAGMVAPERFGASARAVGIGRVIDRLCRMPGSYQITIVVPAHRRAPWQITYSKLETLRKEAAGNGRG